MQHFSHLPEQLLAHIEQLAVLSTVACSAFICLVFGLVGLSFSFFDFAGLATLGNLASHDGHKKRSPWQFLTVLLHIFCGHFTVPSIGIPSHRIISPYNFSRSCYKLTRFCNDNDEVAGPHPPLLPRKLKLKNTVTATTPSQFVYHAASV